jgi:hypothetical protein
MGSSRPNPRSSGRRERPVRAARAPVGAVARPGLHGPTRSRPAVVVPALRLEGAGTRHEVGGRGGLTRTKGRGPVCMLGHVLRVRAHGHCQPLSARGAGLRLSATDAG